MAMGCIVAVYGFVHPILELLGICRIDGCLRTNLDANEKACRLRRRRRRRRNLPLQLAGDQPTPM